MFIIRGLGLGLCVQPLTVTGLSEINPRQLAQASSLNTVARSVSSSLGIAVLATLVQTQARIHFGHIAEEITVGTPLGRLLPALQALFVSRGASLAQAQSTALKILAGLVQKQAFIHAIQDAFKFSLFMVAFAIVAVLFVRKSRRRDSEPTQTGEQKVGLGDGEIDPRQMVLVE
jgi:DHA2 family multidrug resistance protein